MLLNAIEQVPTSQNPCRSEYLFAGKRKLVELQNMTKPITVCVCVCFKLNDEACRLRILNEYRAFGRYAKVFSEKLLIGPMIKL